MYSGCTLYYQALNCTLNRVHTWLCGGGLLVPKAFSLNESCSFAQINDRTTCPLSPCHPRNWSFPSQALCQHRAYSIPSWDGWGTSLWWCSHPPLPSLVPFFLADTSLENSTWNSSTSVLLHAALPDKESRRNRTWKQILGWTRWPDVADPLLLSKFPAGSRNNRTRGTAVGL